jgi:hypothetical protein
MKPDNGNDLPVCGDGTYLELTADIYRQIVCGNSYWMTLSLFDGYRWDGASIPRCLWWLFGKPLSPEFRLASLWHDRLCELSDCIEDRIIADAVFLRLLKDAGVKKWRRVAMWAGVRFYATFIWSFKRWLQKH